MSAMPVMLAILCLMAIAYRYYSGFIAAKVAVLDDSRQTPAFRLNDGHNYHPTNKWVLFGHHFAAISGAGPLIGPVLAAQFGYMPGLLWIVIGVCLAGAVQDFLVLVASMRRDGKSLGQIAFMEIGRTAGTAATIAILFIIVVALAGLGKVVVKALGGEEVKYPAKSQLIIPAGQAVTEGGERRGDYIVPGGAKLVWPGGEMTINESFALRSPADPLFNHTHGQTIDLPATAARYVPGSSWGTFTIACTIPIALFVGLYMYKIRKGKVVEASLIGGALTIGATILGGWVSHQPIGIIFNLKDTSVIWSMAAYGFVASVLPVWVLLCPRDYLSSFLKIGTIGLLVAFTLIANPTLEAPAFNKIFIAGGPVLGAKSPIFPFLFITIMCGAISGFHALVSSGTSPKMIRKESDARVIGYGAMLIEGLVGVVAMIAASTLPVRDYYAMNTPLDKAPLYQKDILQVGGGGGVEHIGQYELLTQESLRGRTGGAVTLAVGFAHIFDQALGRFWSGIESLWKYWYHFAIMFEALFILTTIDTGTRIGRFLLQEVFGKAHPKFGRTDWWPGAVVSTLLIVFGWAYLINANSFDAIWKMFGVANQMLAVIALAIVSVVLVNSGKLKYAWITAIPMCVVAITTSAAAVEMLNAHLATIKTQLAAGPARDSATLTGSLIQGPLILGMLVCAYTIIAAAAKKVWTATDGLKREAVAEKSIS